MAKFAYNNAKNANTRHTAFELNYSYNPQMSYEEKVDPRSQFKSANKLSAEPGNLMVIYCENLYYAQELQKQAHNKSVKTKNYVSSEKIWLNSKYIKTKWN